MCLSKTTYFNLILIIFFCSAVVVLFSDNLVFLSIALSAFSIVSLRRFWCTTIWFSNWEFILLKFNSFSLFSTFLNFWFYHVCIQSNLHGIFTFTNYWKQRVKHYILSEIFSRDTQVGRISISEKKLPQPWSFLKCDMLSVFFW